MALLEFVKAREGCARATSYGQFASYWDAYGKVWTIGYGTTGPKVTAVTVWTQAQCDAALEAKLGEASAQLAATSPGVQWPPGAQDALTDFVYNEGIGRYAGSTVRKCVETADWAGVRAHLLDWEFAAGKRLAGLVTRREGEAAMISDPVSVS